MSGRGSRKRALNWYAMDLHVHTPASSDFQEPQVTYLDLLQRAETRGLELLAFTDHNTVSGYRRLRAEIEELELLERLQRLLPAEKTRLAEYRRLLGKVLLLPGFEFTATFGFHIIGVFSPETPMRDLEHLLLSLNVPHDQVDAGSALVGATSDVLSAYRLIDEAGGLVIAAHANSSNGVAMRGFNFGGQTKIAYTQDLHLHALEVTDLEQKGRRSTAAFFNGTKPEYPRRMHCIQGSDCHRLKRESGSNKNLGLGDRATDVQLEELSFDALRKLFMSGDFARTRPHTTGTAKADEFDYVQQAREEGANIIQDFHESMTQRGGRLYAVLSDVCALANTNGGTLYVGAGADAKQPPVGVTNAAQAVKDLGSEIEQKLTPCLMVTVDTLQSKGKTIIRVQVPRGDDPPYALDDNKIYVRQEAETSLAVRDEIVQLVLRRHALAPVAAPVRPPAAVAPEEPRETPSPSLVENASAEAGAPSAAEPVPPPRTGVEVLATEERNGVHYHTMRDLRNGNAVKNVTRASARKLWHYAISACEAGPLDPTTVTWYGDIGMVKKIHKGEAVRYDLVQRLASGELRVYYGVTDDGVHGPWKHVVGGDEE